MHLIFQKIKLEEAEKWLSSKTSFIKYKNKNVIDFDNWNAKSLYFLDSTGNVLEFIARFDLENKSDKRFDASEILEISEIALVTNNVKEMAAKLLLRFTTWPITASKYR